MVSNNIQTRLEMVATYLKWFDVSITRSHIASQDSAQECRWRTLLWRTMVDGHASAADICERLRRLMPERVDIRTGYESVREYS